MDELKVRFHRLTLRSSQASVDVFALGDTAGTISRFQRPNGAILIGRLFAMNTVCGKDILHLLASTGPGRILSAELLIGERRDASRSLRHVWRAVQEWVP